MPVKSKPENIPVVLLYNVDASWSVHEKEEVILASKQLGQALKETGHPISLVPVANKNLADYLRPFHPEKHIVFNWCESLPDIEHSEWMVARELEQLGFTFTGADSEALALAQNKMQVKEMLVQAGIPTPAWQIYHQDTPLSWNRFPAIVKPVYEHCSAGITRDAVTLDEEALKNRLHFIAKTYRQPALVEDFIDGREFHVSVLGNDQLTTLPAAEMDFSFFSDVKDRLCTYDAKFIPGSRHYEKIETLLPAPLSQEEKKELERVCGQAYRVLGCRDYARLDIRLQEKATPGCGQRKTERTFYVLDVNPNADISIDASMACAAEMAGLSYGQLGSLIVRLAARRHPLMGVI